MSRRATQRALWLVLLISSSAYADEREAVVAARDSVDTWLELIDAAQFSDSLESASPLLRKAITDENWNQALRTSRSPLGTIRSRKLIGAKFAEELPGAPTGEYVVFGFASAFDTKDNMIETVTAKKDSNGIWRVAGYFIR